MNSHFFLLFFVLFFFQVIFLAFFWLYALFVWFYAFSLIVFGPRALLWDKRALDFPPNLPTPGIFVLTKFKAKSYQSKGHKGLQLGHTPGAEGSSLKRLLILIVSLTTGPTGSAKKTSI